MRDQKYPPFYLQMKGKFSVMAVIYHKIFIKKISAFASDTLKLFKKKYNESSICILLHNEIAFRVQLQ